jgi:outer membrane lipoprotein-sorting protein
VILTVLRSDFSVVESTVIDPVGNINRLQFSKITQNSGIPNRAFEFKVPKGVRIIDPPK